MDTPVDVENTINIENIQDKPIKIDQLKKFYDIFEPNFIGIFKNVMNKGKWELNPEYQTPVNKWEDFLEICQKYQTHQYTIYSCYRKLKPSATTREAKEVAFHRYFFIDIDDATKEKNFEDFIIKNNIKYSFKAWSGNGFHYYIRSNDISIVEGEIRDLEKLKAVSHLFINWFIDNQIPVDSKVKDLSRYTRCWGTFNYKRGKYCELLEEKQLSIEEIENNTKIIFNLKPKFNIEFKSPHTKCTNCPLVEKCFEHNFEAQFPEAYINDKLLKNAAAYLLENGRSENEAIFLSQKQNHTKVEMMGWIKKVKEENLKFNCVELRKFCKAELGDHFKETCLPCMLENKNKVLYLNDESLDIEDLKKEYRETGKWAVNRYYRLKGLIKPCEEDEYKEQWVLADKYITQIEETQADEKTLELKDLDKIKKVEYIYFDEPSLSKEQQDKAKLKNIGRVDADFFIYDFIVNNKCFKLLSEIELDTGEAIVDGNITYLIDKKKVGEDKKVRKVLPIIFSHTVQSAVRQYNNWEEVFNDFIYEEQDVSNYIFYKEDNEDEKYLLEYPELFKWMIKAFLFSGKKHSYPLHLVIVGPQGTGKSWLLIALNNKFKERNSFIGGGNVTIKAFVPSAPSNKYNRGYLYDAELLLTVDEMFNIFLKAQNEEDGSVNIQKFNNILENLPITTGTAFGSHKEDLRAKSLWVTNPVDKSHLNFEKSINHFPASSMQRFLFFNMGDQFIKFINSEENKLKEVEHDSKVSNNKWLMLMNFFMGTNAKIDYDKQKVNNIIMNAKKLCPDALVHLYGTRLVEHHFVLLFEGLVKWRIIFAKDISKKANDNDYIIFEQLIEYIVKSWRGNNVNLLTKFENIVLDMIPEEGIHRTTLIRRAEKVFNSNDDDDKFITKIIKDLRSYGYIENGKKDDIDRQTIYRVKEQEVKLDEIQDDGQIRLDQL